MRALQPGNKQLINFCGHGRLPRKTMGHPLEPGSSSGLATLDDIQASLRYNVAQFLYPVKQRATPAHQRPSMHTSVVVVVVVIRLALLRCQVFCLGHYLLLVALQTPQQ